MEVSVRGVADMFVADISTSSGNWRGVLMVMGRPDCWFRLMHCWKERACFGDVMMISMSIMGIW